MLSSFIINGKASRSLTATGADNHAHLALHPHRFSIIRNSYINTKNVLQNK